MTAAAPPPSGVGPARAGQPDPGQVVRAERSLREFAHDAGPELPLYRRLSTVAAATPWLCELLARAQPGQVRAVLLLAAVQRTLFDHPADELAAFYPSLTGQPVPDGDPGPAFLAFCQRHEEAIGALVATRSTQTNEVNRSVAFAAGLRAAAGAQRAGAPLALVELGPSAGLNLRADRYGIDLGDGRVHQVPDSPVRLASRLVGPGRPDVDSTLPPVVARVGLDLHPIDVTVDVEAVRWLEACLWPEQQDRLVRFRAAVAAVRQDPPRLVPGDLIDDLPALLGALPSGAHAVVFHSWVLTYVVRARRAELGEVLRDAARHRPVSWLSAEVPGVVEGVAWPPQQDGGLTVLGLTTMGQGRATTRVLGTCHPHLAWLDWIG